MNCNFNILILLISLALNFQLKAQGNIVSFKKILDEGYENTIVARDKRDYLWFMSRKSDLSTEKKQWIFKKTEELGYDKDMLRFVPHAQ